MGWVDSVSSEHTTAHIRWVKSSTGSDGNDAFWWVTISNGISMKGWNSLWLWGYCYRYDGNSTHMTTKPGYTNLYCLTYYGWTNFWGSSSDVWWRPRSSEWIGCDGYDSSRSYVNGTWSGERLIITRSELQTEGIISGDIIAGISLKNNENWNGHQESYRPTLKYRFGK